MTEFAAWTALAGVVLLWLFVFVLLAIVLRAWHKVAPQVTPLLAMFAPPAPPSSSAVPPPIVGGVTGDDGTALE